MLNKKYTPDEKLRDFEDQIDSKLLSKYIEHQMNTKMDQLAVEVDEMLDNMQLDMIR